MIEKSSLPIVSVIPDLIEKWNAKNRLVLCATPGAGKTTYVPLVLLEQEWMQGQRMLILQPRRIAARTTAKRMADLLGETVGQTVGYRVRLDTKVGQKTRIEVVTEGVLTRMLEQDPTLDGVGLVIFDEFHERHLHSDLGLALVRQPQTELRPELRFLIMSATLDTESLLQSLKIDGEFEPNSIVTCETAIHPLAIHYFPIVKNEPMTDAVARLIQSALRNESGDMLVFLPGVAEIQDVERKLRGIAIDQKTITIRPLHGQLSSEMQDAALFRQREDDDRRRIILSTSIAETSVTVAGVRIVIDCGWMRKMRYSYATGMSRLETERVTQDVAVQRAGRAARLGAGVCYRLGSELEQQHLGSKALPEIVSSDLVPLAFVLASWGAKDADKLHWIDPPPAQGLAHARTFLMRMGAMDDRGELTSKGLAMSGWSEHPRLVNLFLVAMQLGWEQEAAWIAALVDVRQRSLDWADLIVDHEKQTLIDVGSMERIKKEVNRTLEHMKAWKKQQSCVLFHWSSQVLSVLKACTTTQRAAFLMAFAFPDRIAKRRDQQSMKYQLANGRGVQLPSAHPWPNQAWLVVTDVNDRGPDAWVQRAIGIDEHLMEGITACFQERTKEVYWDQTSQAVRARVIDRIGAIVLRESPNADADEKEIQHALCKVAEQSRLALLPWGKRSLGVLGRARTLQMVEPTWPDFSEQALVEQLSDWLLPSLKGKRRLEELGDQGLEEALVRRLSWTQQNDLNEHAPTQIIVPSGSKIALDYSDPAQPVLAVKLQEVFGMVDTPRIAWGRLHVVMHLLSPAMRPVQVTRDLAGFWQSSYFSVRADLRGRYPKHPWPDDPLAAPATSRTNKQLNPKKK